METVSGHKGVELSRTPVVLKSGDWELQVVPWIGGRILSMDHIPSGIVSSIVIFSFSNSINFHFLCIFAGIRQAYSCAFIVSVPLFETSVDL